MDDESFIDAFGDVPTDLAGDYSQLYIFRAEDFGAWCRRVRDAHEREVDGGVAGMTDAQLADHGLCRIGSEAEDNERFRREAGPFCDRLREAAAECADVTLFGVDYIALPVDADGVPIRVGDVMEWPYGNGEFIVEGIGGNTLFYIDKDSNECEWTAAGDKRHHHEPTVDGILRDFGVDIAHALDADPNATVPEAVIAEYAAKLQLREDK